MAQRAENEGDPIWVPTSIGERIRFIRERRRLSQTDLAERLRDMDLPIHQTMISRFEQFGNDDRDSRRPSLIHLVAIALALEVRLVDLGVTLEEYPELRSLRSERALELIRDTHSDMGR